MKDLLFIVYLVNKQNKRKGLYYGFTTLEQIWHLPLARDRLDEAFMMETVFSSCAQVLTCGRRTLSCYYHVIIMLLCCLSEVGAFSIAVIIFISNQSGMSGGKLCEGIMS